MNIDNFNKTKMSLKVALDQIKSNKSNSYIWCAIENSKGCPFELGGRNKEGLEIKAYIPNFDEDKNIVVHNNNFIDSNYSIEIGGIRYSNRNCNFRKEVSNEQLIKYLNKTDFRITSPKIIEHTIMVPETSYSVKL
jgi:hypothetical protein